MIYYNQLDEIYNILYNSANNLYKENAVCKIQKWFKNLQYYKSVKNKETFNISVINTYLNNFININESINDINKLLKNKKIRKINFPSEISENIVKYAVFNKYKIMPNWDTTKSGDLQIYILNKTIKIECKAFSSNGPISFGSNEYWDWIYFVNACDYKNKKFQVYELKMSSASKFWLDIKVNKNETFNNQKRRPRITFAKLLNQIGNNIKLIFDNTVNRL